MLSPWTRLRAISDMCTKVNCRLSSPKKNGGLRHSSTKRNKKQNRPVITSGLAFSSLRYSSSCGFPREERLIPGGLAGLKTSDADVIVLMNGPPQADRYRWKRQIFYREL